jgi:hypothetical protein
MPPPDLGDLTLILGIFMAALPLPVKSVVMHVEVETSQIAISQRPYWTLNPIAPADVDLGSVDAAVG